MGQEIILSLTSIDCLPAYDSTLLLRERNSKRLRRRDSEALELSYNWDSPRRPNGILDTNVICLLTEKTRVIIYDEPGFLCKNISVSETFKYMLCLNATGKRFCFKWKSNYQTIKNPTSMRRKCNTLLSLHRVHWNNFDWGKETILIQPLDMFLKY